MKNAPQLLALALIATLVGSPVIAKPAAGKMMAHHQKMMGHRHFPALRISLKRLEEAKHRAAAAAHGKPIFGGHRGKAIQLIDQAIAELKASEQYAASHRRK